MSGFSKNTRVAITHRVITSISSVKVGMTLLGYKNREYVKSEVLTVERFMLPTINIKTNAGDFSCSYNQCVVDSEQKNKKGSLFKVNDQLFSNKQSLIIQKVEGELESPTVSITTTNGFFLILGELNDMVLVDQ